MKFALKTVLLISLIIAIVLVVQAPASIIRRFIPTDSGLSLAKLEGTLWNGSAQVFMYAEDLGKTTWNWRSNDLTKLTLGYDWSLDREGLSLKGTAVTNGSQSDITVSGLVSDQILNLYLQPYELSISGDLTLENVQTTLADQTLISCDGLLTWEGGATKYRLANRQYQAIVPPLVGKLGLESNHPSLNVTREGGEMTLIKAELLTSGFAKVGITKRFTQLLGNPWPGRDPDHTIVLEVEEQIFLK